MATYFGEILPVSSRAVDEDEDLEDEISTSDSEKERDVILRWGSRLQKSTTNKIDCHLLIVGIGQVACGFLQRHYISRNERPVGIINCGLDTGDHNTISQENLADSSCFIYQIKRGNSSALLVLWHHSATPFQAFSVTKKLFEDLTSDALETYIITTAHISEYKSMERDNISVPLVRCLSTDAKNDEGLIFSKLEVPNIITGLSANVLTHCQAHNIPATLFVSFIEMTPADSINLDAFVPLISLQSLSKFLKDPASEAYSQTPPLVKDCGHLYL